MKVLAICGSIRSNSSNHYLLKAVRKFFPNLKNWIDFEIKNLPFFDPEIQFSPDLPNDVKLLRLQALQSDFIVISTPEYAHGIPGILKNALEWLVCEETMQKKILIFIGTPSGGDYVKEYLLETLRTMDMVASLKATFVVRGARTQISPSGEVLDPALQKSLVEFLLNNST